MNNLINAYSLETVVIICGVAIASLFPLYKACCYVWDRYKNNHVTLPQRLEILEAKFELLNDSDMAKTRGEFIKQHQYFMRLGKIDNLSLSYLHELLDVYEKRGGDGYVHRLMEDIDNLEVIQGQF